MIPRRNISLRFLGLVILSISTFSQQVYEPGTFVSYPAGKHVNHSYYSTWNVYFAVEDGVLVYNHHTQEWLDPITISDGLSQYPILLVWQNASSQDVWIITPDFVFIYDELSKTMSRQTLPADPLFSGSYDLGISDQYLVISAGSGSIEKRYSALFSKVSGSFERWGSNADLELNLTEVEWLGPFDPELNDIYESLPVQTISNGSFDAEGNVHMDGHPRNSMGQVSAITGDRVSGDVFLSTYGAGIFHQDISGGDFMSLPFGLLSPDIMTMDMYANKLVLGGRAGLTFMDSSVFEYDEAIKEIAFDYSFVTDIDASEKGLIIAGRGGVFQRSESESHWQRIVSKKDLSSERIYAVASGSHGNIMIATERNAYLYHESGLQLSSLFPVGLDWPVFHITYHNDLYYISSYYGLFIYSENEMGFIGSVNSSGAPQPVKTAPGIDPVYESVIKNDKLWASTHRGLMVYDLITQKGSFFLSPHAPFKPRGLTVTQKSVWVGTDIGLFSFNSKSSAWRHFTVNDGLISNFVTELISRDDYIWVGTNLGLTRLKWKNLY